MGESNVSCSKGHKGTVHDWGKSCRECLKARVKELEQERDVMSKTFSHYHRAHRNTDDELLDTCGKCGLDIRHPVHIRVSEPEKVGESVDCATCGKAKKPVGRSAPPSIAADLCDSHMCDGYWDDPQPGGLWPGENGEKTTAKVPEVG